MLECSKKIKKRFWRYYLLHLFNQKFSDMMYSSWDIERDRMKLVTLGRFLIFNP